MTAPSAVVRGTPAGIQLDEGFSATLAMENLTTISFWEKTMGAPAIEGGDPIDQSTMHNSVWMTQLPPTLLKLEPFTLTAAYDPNVISQAIAQTNANQTMTVTWPDGSTLSFYGWLRKIEFADMSHGTLPECTVTIEPSNIDPATQAEEAPVYVDVAGT